MNTHHTFSITFSACKIIVHLLWSHRKQVGGQWQIYSSWIGFSVENPLEFQDSWNGIILNSIHSARKAAFAFKTCNLSDELFDF